MNKLLLAAALLTLMFLVSGYDKIMNFSGNVMSLQGKIGLNIPIVFSLAILIVILLELVGSSMILYSAYSGKKKEYAYYSTIGLIIFTIIATLLYHMPIALDNHALFKNIAVVGGLLLLADKFRY